MRTIFTLIAFIFIVQTIYSQDLIVTTDNDSINCKITRTSKENIYFTFKHKDEIRNTLLPFDRVKDHKTAFFQKSEVSKDRIKEHHNYQHLRIAINGGFGYETASI